MSTKEKILKEIERLYNQAYSPEDEYDLGKRAGYLNVKRFVDTIPDEPEGVKKYAVYDNNDPISIFPLTATGKDFSRITKCLLPPKHNPRVIEVEIREVKK